MTDEKKAAVMAAIDRAEETSKQVVAAIDDSQEITIEVDESNDDELEGDIGVACAHIQLVTRAPRRRYRRAASSSS